MPAYFPCYMQLRLLSYRFVFQAIQSNVLKGL